MQQPQQSYGTSSNKERPIGAVFPPTTSTSLLCSAASLAALGAVDLIPEAGVLGAEESVVSLTKGLPSETLLLTPLEYTAANSKNTSRSNNISTTDSPILSSTSTSSLVPPHSSIFGASFAAPPIVEDHRQLIDGTAAGEEDGFSLLAQQQRASMYTTKFLGRTQQHGTTISSEVPRQQHISEDDAAAAGND
jgi:hypothetical protein